MHEKDRDTGRSTAQSTDDDRQVLHDDFVKHLLAKIEPRLQTELDPEIQVEISQLLDLLVSNRKGFVTSHRVYFEAAFELLATDKPNLLTVQRLRSNLQIAEERVGGGLTGLLIKFCGPQPLTAMFAGLVSMFCGLGLVLALLLLAHTMLSRLEHVIDTIHPIVVLLSKLPIGDIIILILSSFIGSVVSVVTRYGNTINSAAYHPLQIYIGVLFRPLISLAFALFIYALLKTGIVSFLGVQLDGAKGVATLWCIGFLAGYSERFAKDFISQAETKLGVSK